MVKLDAKKKHTHVKITKYTIPFILVVSLFFLWGFAHSILDVLNKHFQEVFIISKARSALVQSVVYGGYFIMALPAGFFIKKYGYRSGVVLGLLLYGIGALLFVPAGTIMSFNYFLFCLFTIGCGLTFLETAANPYITVLGDKDLAASRLNLAQSFNGLGWIIGPLLGGVLLFHSDNTQGDVAIPYTIIGVVVLLVAIVFMRIKLPELEIQNTDSEISGKSMLKDKIFIFGVVAMVFYVGAQTGINSFFINYITELNPEVSLRNSALLLSFGGMGLFMLGRFVGSWMMRFIAPAKLLTYAAIAATCCMLLVIMAWPWTSSIALIICYLFEAIMFPTIFAISIENLGVNTKRGSSFLIMAIVGGAIVPPMMGYIGHQNMAIGFIIPLICFIIITVFGVFLMKTKLIKLKTIKVNT